MITQVDDNWYETFFTGINCEMWEKALPASWSEKEALFLEDVMALKIGMSVLDIPSGFGRLALPLAEKGIQVTCVDISIPYVENLQQRVKESNLPIQVLHGDMMHIDLPEQYDGAYCLGNSFGYFDYDGLVLFVKKIGEALLPGACFVINSGMLPESILADIPADKSYALEGLTMKVHNEYQIQESCMISQLTYTKNDQTEKHAYKHYVYTMAEIKRLLLENSLVISSLYSSIEKQSYVYGDKQVYIVARKQPF